MSGCPALQHAAFGPAMEQPGKCVAVCGHAQPHHAISVAGKVACDMLMGLMPSLKADNARCSHFCELLGSAVAATFWRLSVPVKVYCA
jgi:hypothetical protein